MNKPNDIDVLLENYWAGTLDDQAMAAFTERLKSDAKLREAFKIQQEIKEALSDTEAIEFENLVSNVIRDQPSPEKTTSANNLKYWIVGVLAVLLMAYFLFKMTAKPSAEQIYASYYEVYPVFIGSRSDLAIEKNWMTDYDSENYKKVIESLEALNERNQLDNFYLAQCYLNQNNLATAFRMLDTIEKEGVGNFFLPSLWYKALILIKRGKIEEARLLLSQLQKEPGKYGNLATKLMKDLQN